MARRSKTWKAARTLDAKKRAQARTTAERRRRARHDPYND